MASYVHHCAFCGWSRAADDLTILDPACERCGCTLTADTVERYEETRRAPGGEPREQTAWDMTGPLSVVLIAAIALPMVGFELGDVVFALPFIVLIFAATRCVVATRRGTALRWTWRSMAVGAGLAAVASAIALVTAMGDFDGTIAFYVGAAASVAMVVAVAPLGRRSLRRLPVATAIDCSLVGLPVLALGVYFVALPGLERGDLLLTGITMVDLVAVFVGAVAAVACREVRDRRTITWLTLSFAAAFAGDAVVSATAAGQLDAGPIPTAVLWTVAAYFVALAADQDRPDPLALPRQTARTRRLASDYLRAALPLVAVLCFPATTLALGLLGYLDVFGAVFFGVLSALQLALALGRQVHLLVEHRRAAERERRLRQETARRNEELEALTGLATTMTQTLEEAPLTEQALKVLHLAARASSSALHVRTPRGHTELHAAVGRWRDEATWAGTPAPARTPTLERSRRGQREIVRLPMRARERDIGTITLVRPASSPFEERELDLLQLLVDELAVAIQNARDYREKLEQAIRDPLTGVYNRRFFVEALEKEVRRCERYGGDASLLIFDIDNFKSINDAHGHAVGDRVLREVAAAIGSSLRPTDSVARIGGEEFAVLLPETRQLDALMIAERARSAISSRPIVDDRRVTVSSGLASCPQDARAREELHRRADAALYWAKRNGKDMCAVASDVAVDAVGPAHHEGLQAHLHALVSGIDGVDRRRRGHSENVASYAAALAQSIGLPSGRVLKVRRAALLHDVGKIAVPREILGKDDRLTDEEMERVKVHAALGGAMVAHAGLREEADWVRHHHERLDGSGYPDGLSGQEVPLEARIILVADAFEAMTRGRPYRAGMTVDAALSELHRCSGTQFDPAVVEALERLLADGDLPFRLSLRGRSLASEVPEPVG